MSKTTVRITRIVVLGAGALLAWCGLNPDPAPPSWLRVEAPPFAVVDQPLPIRVHLQLPAGEPPVRLNVDLHWTTWTRSSRGLLAASQWVDATPATGDFVFEIPVVDRAHLASVFAVIYLGPTGTWPGRSRAASTERIPVVRGNQSGAGEKYRSLRVFEPARAEVLRPERSRAAQYLCAGLLLVAAARCLFLRNRGHARDFESERGSNHLLATLAVLLALAGIWDLFNVGSRLSQRGRILTRELGVYSIREPVQRLATAGIVAAAAGACWYLSRFKLTVPLRIAIGTAILYWGFCLATALSLHAFDAWASRVWWEFSTLQGLKLAGAVTTVAALLLAQPMPSRVSNRVTSSAADPPGPGSG